MAGTARGFAVLVVRRRRNLTSVARPCGWVKRPT
jgi:hypothetical protein